MGHHMKPQLLKISTLALAALMFSGCAITTAGVKKGDERNLLRSSHDVNIDRVVRARLKRNAAYDLTGVNIDVAEGIVVLSGNTLSEDARIEAERVAWSAQHVVQVGNEILVEGKQTVSQNARDGLLNNSVKARLVADRNVKARNFNIEVHNGKVYLLGVARHPAELERAAYIASTTKGTQEVVSYVRIHDPSGPATFEIPETYESYNASPTPQSQYAEQSYRELPQGLTSTPQAEFGGPQQAEPYYVDPITKERIEIPPGVTPIPLTPEQLSDMGLGAPLGNPSQTAPYYIDPETGKQIPVKFVQPNR